MINYFFQNRGLLDLSRTDESLGSMSHSIVGSDWAQVEIINLVNDGTGLGFGNYYFYTLNSFITL